MARKAKPQGWIGLAIAGGAAALGTAAYYYLRDGAGSEKDAALIPKVIEDQLDRVVDALNQHFGRKWVNLGLGALQKGLASVLPLQLVSLVEFVHQAEEIGLQKGWSGAQKQRHASALASA